MVAAMRPDSDRSANASIIPDSGRLPIAACTRSASSRMAA
jgi:hypothetical protein